MYARSLIKMQLLSSSSLSSWWYWLSSLDRGISDQRPNKSTVQQFGLEHVAAYLPLSQLFTSTRTAYTAYAMTTGRVCLIGRAGHRISTEMQEWTAPPVYRRGGREERNEGTGKRGSLICSEKADAARSYFLVVHVGWWYCTAIEIIINSIPFLWIAHRLGLFVGRGGNTFSSGVVKNYNVFAVKFSTRVGHFLFARKLNGYTAAWWDLEVYVSRLTSIIRLVVCRYLCKYMNTYSALSLMIIIIKLLPTSTPNLVHKTQSFLLLWEKSSLHSQS